MWFVLELGEYAERTSDRELVARARERVYALLSYFRRFENEFGLLEKLESWVFLEWSKSNDLVQDVSFPSNMLYAKMKLVMSELYGDAALAEEAQRMQAVIRDLSYTADGTLRRIYGKLSILCLPYGHGDARPVSGALAAPGT